MAFILDFDINIAESSHKGTVIATNPTLAYLLFCEYPNPLHIREPDGLTSCYPIPQDGAANRKKVGQSILSI